MLGGAMSDSFEHGTFAVSFAIGEVISKKTRKVSQKKTEKRGSHHMKINLATAGVRGRSRCVQPKHSNVRIVKTDVLATSLHS